MRDNTINMYSFSFSLYPEQYQPSGTINMSRISDVDLNTQYSYKSIINKSKFHAKNISKIYDVDIKECCICFEEIKNKIIISCGHTTICEKCVIHLDLCPICRTMITHISNYQ